MTMIGRRSFARMVVLIALLTIGAVARAADGYENVDAAGLENLIERGVKVVDVRTPEEWRATGVIPGSKQIMAFDSRGHFEPSFAAALQAFARPEEELALICWSGSRSRAVAEALSRQGGYTKVYNVTGGMAAWLEERRPVASCETC